MKPEGITLRVLTFPAAAFLVKLNRKRENKDDFYINIEKSKKQEKLIWNFHKNVIEYTRK